MIACIEEPQLIAKILGHVRARDEARSNLPTEDQVLALNFKNHDLVFPRAFVLGITKLTLKMKIPGNENRLRI